MKKSVLPLSESFIIHATALLNHVHQCPRTPLVDSQAPALRPYREKEAPFRLDDAGLLQQLPQIDASRK